MGSLVRTQYRPPFSGPRSPRRIALSRMAVLKWLLQGRMATRRVSANKLQLHAVCFSAMVPPMEAVRNFGPSAEKTLWRIGGDRIGVFASVLCAIHCAATPFLLLFLPVFGKAWAHPASHWLMALVVVPLAAATVYFSYRRHRRKWVVVSAVLGIIFVIVGAAAPSFEKLPSPGDGASVAGDDQSATGVASSCGSMECEKACGDGVVSAETDSEQAVSATVEAEASTAPCVDACCPSLQAGEDGEWTLHVPLASILTTIGGLFLIATHVGNLCRCSCCETSAAEA